jgi:hypothetical protein
MELQLMSRPLKTTFTFFSLTFYSFTFYITLSPLTPKETPALSSNHHYKSFARSDYHGHG